MQVDGSQTLWITVNTGPELMALLEGLCPQRASPQLNADMTLEGQPEVAGSGKDLSCRYI